MRIPEDWAGLLGTGFIVIAVLLRSFAISHGFDLLFTLLGSSMWIIEGKRLNSRSNIWLNVFCVGMVISGIVFTHFF